MDSLSDVDKPKKAGASTTTTRRRKTAWNEYNKN
jgi:hypothetical protein